MLRLITIASVAFLTTACVGMVDRHDALQANAISIAKLMADITTIQLKRRTEIEVLEAAKQNLTLGLKDPMSAQFKNVRLVDYNNGKVICGEVNAKNSYGGYIGFQRFIASPSEAVIEKPSPNRLDIASYAGIRTACK